MDATESPDPERDIPPPDESGVRVVVERRLASRYEARKGGYAIARSASLPALLRWSRIHLREGTEIVRLDDDALMATIEPAIVFGLVGIQAMLRWVGMRMRPRRGHKGRFRRASWAA